MRVWLNAILAFIGTASLTDLEFNAIDTDVLTLNTYNTAVYSALSAVITSRGDAGNMQTRLVSFFKAKGLEVSADIAVSNIYLGSVLE